MEQQPRKGMSKGCLIALIVAGALLVILIVIFALLYAKRDEVVKWGTKSAITMVKAEIAKNAAAGVDTTRFNALADSFLTRITNDTLDYKKYPEFVAVLQRLTADKKIEPLEVRELSEAMGKYYPDLDSLARLVVSDSVAVAPAPADSTTAKPPVEEPK